MHPNGVQEACPTQDQKIWSDLYKVQDLLWTTCTAAILSMCGALNIAGKSLKMLARLHSIPVLYTTSYLHNAAATLMLLTYTRYTFVHMAVKTKLCTPSRFK